MKTFIRFSTLLLTLVATFTVRADEVTDWNHILLKSLLTAKTSPLVAGRVCAIVQAAVFDAVNGIERRYTYLHVAPAADRGASRRAAAVQAAYGTLVNYFPPKRIRSMPSLRPRWPQYRAVPPRSTACPLPAENNGARQSPTPFSHGGAPTASPRRHLHFEAASRSASGAPRLSCCCPEPDPSSQP
jgi:hypothetical protein